MPYHLELADKCMPAGRCCAEHRKRDSIDNSSVLSEHDDDDRKQRARQRQQEMMQRMALQQAAFFEQSGVVEVGQSTEKTAPHCLGLESAARDRPTEQTERESRLDTNADHDRNQGSQSAGPSSTHARQLSEEDGPLMSRANAGNHLYIPRQHPAAWAQPSGECVFCHLDDPDCGPLGRLCFVRVNPVPAYASRDYSANWNRLKRWVEDAPSVGIGDMHKRLMESQVDTESQPNEALDKDTDSCAFQATPSSYTAPSTLEACDQHSYAAGGPMLSEVCISHAWFLLTTAVKILL